MIEPVPVNTIEDIDLDSHCVIEASAGTGKTYTIEHLVVELIKSGRARGIEDVLVLTFTEKATGELRQRIRDNIRAALEKSPSAALRDALDCFDSAAIYTIHGFCQRVLQGFAFENAEQFSYDVVDDLPLYGKLLKKQMREQWPAMYGADLGAMLRLSGYPERSGSSSRWEERVISMARAYSPLAGDGLVPGPVEDMASLIKEYESTVNRCLSRLVSLAGHIDHEDPGKSDLYRRYGSLNINGTRKKRILNKIITPFLRLLAGHEKKGTGIAEFARIWKTIELREQGFQELNMYWNSSGPDYEDKMPELIEVIHCAEELRGLDISGLAAQLAVRTIARLKNDLARYKRERGLISYDDMIALVAAPLMEQNSPLRESLRQRYRYGIVDEFQDTDMLQWNIFRSVFLGSPGNRLFIIGDPKQAIYGFRGADIFAYYRARREMLENHGARYYSLTGNWRSGPELIESFNALFRGGNWFTDRDIAYADSRYPSAKEKQRKGTMSKLSIVDLGTVTGSQARKRAARFIGAEIQEILNNRNLSIKENEIAILVRKWSEAGEIESMLSRSGIRYSYYKKEGLYQSREALEIRYLLAAIEDPGNGTAMKKAMVTRFFGVPLSGLLGFNDMEQDHPALILVNKWHVLALERKWSKLFQSVLEDTGIMVRIMEEENPERISADYRHIIENLEVEAYNGNYDIHELAGSLNNFRNMVSRGEESFNYHRLEKEEPGVQIMTVHAAKGLQFRAVFIAGGFTRPKDADYRVYHSGGHRVFDVLKNPENRDAFEREKSFEEERLFYVALTRAVELLYVPVFTPAPGNASKSGALSGWIARALKALDPVPSVQRVEYVADGGADIPAAEKPAAVPDGLSLPSVLFPDLPDFSARKIGLHSFSGIAVRLHGREHTGPRAAFLSRTDSVPGSDDSGTAPAYDEAGPTDTAGLPGGTGTGLMLHGLLEKLDYAAIDAAKKYQDLLGMPRCEALIDEMISRFFPEAKPEKQALYRDETARILWNSLKAPVDDTGFCFSRAGNRVHEMEFFFPYRGFAGPGVPELSYNRGYVHGFMDMVFQRDGRYYILDWKSNYLEDGYAKDSLERNMRESHYILQYRIYTLAVVKWLRRTVKDFSFHRHFGGIYYVYLRGMDPAAPGRGIYFYRPESEDEVLGYEG